MEQTANTFTPEAATDEPASFPNPHRPAPPSDPPSFEPPPLLSDALDEAIAETLDATFTPDAPTPRHDGWTPEAIAAFLRQLAAGGVVEHAARAAGLSAQAAYAFRNRRQGRAFARMWDAVLVHRTRARLASELHSRAIAGCVSVRKKDGVVVGEYHYYDNRLANALLTRLDRLAEREEGSDAHLRALSEDLDDYLDCLAAGGDADAFVEARRLELSEAEGPAEPEVEQGSGDGNVKPRPADAFDGCEVWQDDEGEWWTEFPPPHGFDGEEEGSYGEDEYRRTLTASERIVIEADEAEERAEMRAQESARRDLYFGFEDGDAKADEEEE